MTPQRAPDFEQVLPAQRTAVVMLRPGEMAYIPGTHKDFAANLKAKPEVAYLAAFREIKEVVADPTPRAYLLSDRHIEYPLHSVYLADPKVECRRLFCAFVESYKRAYGFVPDVINNVVWALP